MQLLDLLLAAMNAVRADCSDLRGVVLATPEGLVLAACGSLQGEVAAAMASGLAGLLDHHLQLLASPSITDAIFWTADAQWGLVRLDSQHVALAQAEPRISTGTLRLVLARLRRDLGRELLRGEEGAG